MPTNQTETENYEEQLKGKEEKPQQNAQPVEPREQEHTDDIEGSDDDTEELAAGGPDNDDANILEGDEGIDDAPEQQVAPDDADMEGGKSADADDVKPWNSERDDGQS